MSRIGRKPINIPAGVDVNFENGVITVKGSKGTLTQKIHPNMTVTIEENVITVTRPNDEKENRALHGLTRSLIANMIEGVTNGFKKELEVNGVGYRVQKQGKNLVMNLGYSHQVTMSETDDIKIEVPAPNKIKKLVNLPLKYAKNAHQSHIKAKALSMQMNIFVAKKAKLVRAVKNS